MLVKLLQFDSSRPVVARTGGSAAIGSANFLIANLLQRDLRASRRMAVQPEASGIDGANDAAADDAAAAEEARVRLEQGFDTEMHVLEHAGLLRVFRDAIAEDLLENAAMIEAVTKPGVQIPDPFHVGAPFVDAIQFQISRAPQALSEARVMAEARALGVKPEVIRAAVLNRHNRQVQFLKDNRQEILDKYEGLVALNADGHPYTTAEVEAVFDKLPAMTRLRLCKAADSGMYKATEREVERHLNGNGEAMGNVGLLNGTRRELRASVAKLMADGNFKREVDAAQSRGANMPVWSPAPPTLEEQEALRKAA